MKDKSSVKKKHTHHFLNVKTHEINCKIKKKTQSFAVKNQSTNKQHATFAQINVTICCTLQIVKYFIQVQCNFHENSIEKRYVNTNENKKQI